MRDFSTSTRPWRTVPTMTRPCLTRTSLYRRKADVDYSDPSAVKADVAAAKDWSSKAMGTRKANEEKKDKGPGGITMDSSGNLK